LLTVPHVAAVVGDSICTDALAPAARLPNAQRSTPPEIWQPERAGLTLQLVPALVGTVSLSRDIVAAEAPLFLSVSVYPIF
jgi:hypothetical protein